ncbi:hypothetical protein M2158_005425 [Streptomyces sp. SAI-144]|jgi:hypothetical protein|nr:hypothetical protein [Streptomyces sp. SAI-144]MDH6484262.1 hypothetical protein [Streptomyces sp. SAI-127]
MKPGGRERLAHYDGLISGTSKAADMPTPRVLTRAARESLGEFAGPP